MALITSVFILSSSSFFHLIIIIIKSIYKVQNLFTNFSRDYFKCTHVCARMSHTHTHTHTINILTMQTLIYKLKTGIEQRLKMLFTLHHSKLIVVNNGWWPCHVINWPFSWWSSSAMSQDFAKEDFWFNYAEERPWQGCLAEGPWWSNLTQHCNIIIVINYN